MEFILGYSFFATGDNGSDATRSLPDRDMPDMLPRCAVNAI